MSLQEIIDYIISYINTNFSDLRIDTRVGTVIRNAIITPIAYILSLIYGLLNDVKKAQFVDAATGNDLDLLASNYGVTRSASVSSSGKTRIYRRVALPAGVTELVVPIGIKVYGGGLTFETISEGRITNDNIENNVNSPYYGRYYAEVYVRCTTPGAIGNVGVGVINQIQYSGVDGVDNPEAFVNGKDEQNDEEFRAYIKSRAQSHFGTLLWYESIIRENYNIKKIKTIPFTSDKALENKVNGTLNIIIVSDNFNTYFQNYIGIKELDIANKPLLNVNYVKVDGNILDPSKYLVNIDYDTIYRRSIKELSKVVIDNSVQINNDSKIELNYDYNVDIGNIQIFLDLPDKKILGTDVWVKLGLPVDLKITFNLKTIIGYDYNEVVNNIKNMVVNYIDSLDLGTTLQVSDLVNQIYNVEGVDYIIVGLVNKIKLEYKKYGESNYTEITGELIELLDPEYFTINSNNININSI